MFDKNKKYTIDWDLIDSFGRTKSGGIKKMDLSVFPKKNGNIRWKDSVGIEIPVLFDEKEYIFTIDKYECIKKPALYVNVKGFNKLDYRILPTEFKKCELGRIITNVYANPNLPNRDLIISSVGEELSKTLNISSNTKIDLICPVCKTKRPMTLNHLNTYGFTCKKCESGTPYPERFVSEFFKYCGIVFSEQKTLDGHKSRYDFFLSEYNIIIESHGMQHYNGGFEYCGGRNLKEEQEKDLYKKLLANIWGYKYIEIDCRHSNPEWIKDSILKSSLIDIINIDVNNIDWNVISKNAESNLVLEICNYFNKNKMSGKDISKIFNIEHSKVCRYLKRGSKLGLCDYNGSEIRVKATTKPVVKMTMDYVFIERFESCMDAQRSGYDNSGVNSCCQYYKNKEEYILKHGRSRKTYKGFKWMFEDDYNNLINNGLCA